MHRDWVVVGLDNGGSSNNATVLHPEKGFLVEHGPLPPGTLMTLWNDDERFLESYWSHFRGKRLYMTGDYAIQDEDGYFHFAARSDDLIISSGYNIAGPEVEAALLSHDDVAECAVIGAPDEARGQIVEAYVVVAKGVKRDALTVKRLQDHVKTTIAPYKYPRSVKFIDALPKTQTGKIQRFRLREMH